MRRASAVPRLGRERLRHPRSPPRPFAGGFSGGPAPQPPAPAGHPGCGRPPPAPTPHQGLGSPAGGGKGGGGTPSGPPNRSPCGTGAKSQILGNLWRGWTWSARRRRAGGSAAAANTSHFCRDFGAFLWVFFFCCFGLETFLRACEYVELRNFVVIFSGIVVPSQGVRPGC